MRRRAERRIQEKFFERTIFEPQSTNDEGLWKWEGWQRVRRRLRRSQNFHLPWDFQPGLLPPPFIHCQTTDHPTKTSSEAMCGRASRSGDAQPHLFSCRLLLRTCNWLSFHPSFCLLLFLDVHFGGGSSPFRSRIHPSELFPMAPLR